MHNQSIALPMSGYASSGITILRGIDRLESIELILPSRREEEELIASRPKGVMREELAQAISKVFELSMNKPHRNRLSAAA